MTTSGAAATRGWPELPERGDTVARLRSLLRPEFLAEAGWDEENGVFFLPRDHVLRGAPKSTPSLKGLPEQVQLELLVGLQARADSGISTQMTVLRCLVENLRAQRVRSVQGLDPEKITSSRADTTVLFRFVCTSVRRGLASPETERVEDVWDLAVFGIRGALDFTAITQCWLRETAKRWAEHDLPLHRGTQANQTARGVVAAVRELSETLRLARDDRGEEPRELERRDVVAVMNRLAFKERTGTISGTTRANRCRNLRRFLDDIRILGLTRAGQPAAGLPADVLMLRSDVPSVPRQNKARDLPDWVMEIVTDNLAVLERRSGPDTRRAVEILRDTGRRPIEVCKLPLDCLDRDKSGAPVLVYHDLKNNRPSRRLPIEEKTARTIQKQQEYVTSRFSDTPRRKLPLFPRDVGNRAGTKPAEEKSLTEAYRKFIRTIGHLFEQAEAPDDGTKRRMFFDPAKIVPYSYRHTYAQRHADNGTPPDVLRDLMDHSSMQTTLSYYHVTEKRVRAAVDRVIQHQFDASGSRISHHIANVLNDEHLRLRVGQIPVPFGVCTEPSNVQAGGRACPKRYACVGCGHFRTDASYLPELKSYLQQLLADQERWRAAVPLAGETDRGRSEAGHDDIARLRALVRRVEADLVLLADHDRALIDQAIALIRRTRQTVHLGMPTIASRSHEDVERDES